MITPLPPFATFRADEFHIGGDPDVVDTIASSWQQFGEECDNAASGMKSLDSTSFEGTEGERFTELVSLVLPSQLGITSEAHTEVGNAISGYAEGLATAHDDMDALIAQAKTDHTAVNNAVVRYEQAKLAAEAAKTAAAGVGGIAAPIALAAEAEVQEAKAHYYAMKEIWEHDLDRAKQIKERLGEVVKKTVDTIDSEAREAFDSKPSGVQEAISFVDGLVQSVFDWYDKIVGGALDGTYELMDDTVFATNRILDAALDASNTLWGKSTWGEVKQDLKAAVDTFKDNEFDFLGDEDATTAGEPVDVFSGALVDFSSDVFIDGILPIELSRSCVSSRSRGGVFGAQWGSNVDCRLEVFDDQVLMLSPTGAVVRFDPPNVDGMEIRGKGRPWLLSFVDGAYRVRDVTSGLVYVFTTASEALDHLPNAPLDEEAFKNGVSEAEQLRQKLSNGEKLPGYGRGSSTVAAYLGLGLSYKLSAILHRSGMWLEYVYDDFAGNLVQIIRSDGTTVDLLWDDHVSRLASVWVRNDDELSQTPKSETLDAADLETIGAQCLIKYEYDQGGLLRRIVNSQEGALSYLYNSDELICGWRDRNGVCYQSVFDDSGRVVAQAGTGGMFANAFVWLDDIGADAPVDGRVCVAIETAGEFAGDPLVLGDSVIEDRLQRLENLPLVQALRSGGLKAGGLIGCGRDGARDVGKDSTTDGLGTMPREWLRDEVLGDIRATVFRSTSSGDVWRIVDPTGSARDYFHDEYHQLVGIHGPSGAMLEIVRDTYGGISEVVYPDGSGVRVEESGVWGKPVRVVDSFGFSTEYELDAAGNIVAVTDPLGRTSQCEYRWFSDVVVPWKFTGFDGVSEIVECDGAGRVLAREDARGSRWSVVRDTKGQITEAMNPLGDITTMEYSPEGWLTGVTLPDGTQQRAVFDGEGNPTELTNPVGAVTRTKYTVFDRPAVSIDATGGVTKLVYNTQMELIGIINADGNRWDYRRNLDGRIVEESDYNGLVTKYEQDLARKTSSVIDPIGGIQTSYFDEMGRLLKVEDSCGEVTEYHYTAQGDIAAIVNPDSHISYRRDEFGRIEAELTRLSTGEISTVEAHRDGYGRLAGSSITVAGHLTQQKYDYDTTTGDISGMGIYHNTPSGNWFSDKAAVGALQEVAQIRLGTDTLGRRNGYDVGSMIRQMGFDVRGRVVADVIAALDSTIDDGMRVVAGRQFTWRSDNVLTKVEDVLNGSSVFNVDAIGRVTSVHHDPTSTIDALLGTTPDSPQVGNVSTDPQKFQGSTNNRGVTELYEYSSAGQLRGMHTPDYRLDTGIPRSRAEVESQQFPTLVENVSTKNTLVTEVGKTRYQYDHLGRVITITQRRISRKPLVKHFTYRGSSGQIATFSSSDDPFLVWEYTYDGRHRRVAKTCIDTRSNNVVTKVVFGYLGDHLAVEHYTLGHDDGTLARMWVADPETGDIIGQLTSKFSQQHLSGSKQIQDWSKQEITAQFFALVTDFAGAPKELIDTTNGQVIGRATQTLYGRRNWKGTKCPLLFSGQYEDNESNLVYNRYRYYDPHAGVYTAQDPLGAGPNPATAQGYVTNPTTYVDYYGLKQCSTASDTPAKNKTKGNERRDHVAGFFEEPKTEKYLESGVDIDKLQASTTERRFVDVWADDTAHEVKASKSKITGSRFHKDQVFKDAAIIDGEVGETKTSRWIAYVEDGEGDYVKTKDGQYSKPMQEFLRVQGYVWKEDDKFGTGGYYEMTPSTRKDALKNRP